ncbi:MAG TPA: transglycosylase SLT domain-containing protein [Gemmatimonadaceae bacterium]
MPLRRPILAVAALAVTACIPATHAAPALATAGGVTRAASPLDSVATSAGSAAAEGSSVAVVQAGTRAEGPSSPESPRVVAGGGMLEAAPADATATPRVDEAVSSLAMDVSAYESRDRVEYYVKRFTGPAREYIASRLEAGSRYEPMIRQEMEAGGLPGDMYYLALVESGFDPNAYSRAAAVGMWQFMTSTARGMGLRVDWWVDERRDPVRSTRAAVRFIRELRDQFGSLYLAAAAYNGGPGRIQRGLNRFADDMEGAGSEDRFFVLADKDYLRNETREYVPQLIAATLVAREPDRYGMTVGRKPPLVLDSAKVPGLTPIAAIAAAAGSTVAEIQGLNPQLLRGMTPPGPAVMVWLPAGRAERFDAALAELDEAERVGARRTETKKGVSLAEVADKAGISEKALLGYNPKLRRTKKGRIVPGQPLLVPTPAVVRAAVSVPDPEIERYGSTTVGKVRFHVVKKGETLSHVAKRYHVTVAKLKAMNHLKKDVIFPGQELAVSGVSVSSKAKGASKARSSSSKSKSSASKAKGTSKGKASSAKGKASPSKAKGSASKPSSTKKPGPARKATHK